MFIANNTGTLARFSGYTLDGMPSFASGISVKCGLVRLAEVDQKTSVRTDSSASRGAGEETVIKYGKVLFPVSINPSTGDKFTIYGVSMRIMSVEPRVNVLGKQDHWECDLEVWSA
jgi:hypothetical protein